MKKKLIAGCLAAVLVAGLVAGCGNGEKTKSVKLDPDNPVSLTVWHYYNGARQAAFDELVEEFNASEGKDKGIYVEAYSKGSISDLEQAISDALEGKVGAEELPDMFSSYADTAYSVQEQDRLADLTQYFSEEELEAYVDSYIQEGYFNGDGALYLLPIAKSTEIMMVNKTDWDSFAEATGSTVDELATTEGVTKVAERYYEWTDSLTPDIEGDGKAFYGRDSMANYMIIGMKQMGTEIFDVKDGEVTFQLDKDKLRRLWDNYYVPYVKGYFAAYGKFRSDDVKTGDILAYTGSTSSVMYFPDALESDEGSYAIDYLVLPAPVMEGGSNCKVQQGAGMAVSKSDERHEYASCVFLKWMTQKRENLKFVGDSGYLPVLKEANSREALEEALAEENIEMNQKAYDCLTCVMDDFENTEFYTTKNFENGYQTRQVLEYSMSDRAAADKAAIDEAVKNGTDRKEAEEEYVSDASFESWYEELQGALAGAAE